MISSKKMGGAVTAVIYVLILAALVLLISMPWVMGDDMARLLGGRAVGMTALYIGGGAGVWLLAELLFIMKSVKRGEPFIMRNVASLKRIALCCIISCSAVILVLCFRFSISFIICATILAFGALAAYTLSLVFRQAVEYKEENDLTV